MFWIDEVGPWLPDDHRKQELPLKLFPGFKVDDIQAWTFKSSSLLESQRLVPQRIIKTVVEDVELSGREQIGPELIVAKSDGMFDSEQWKRYFERAKKCYIDGDPIDTPNMDPSIRVELGGDMEETEPKSQFDSDNLLVKEEINNANLYQTRYYFARFQTETAADIMLGILPETLDLFLDKNKDYGDITSDGLGLKGLFPDIWRKTAKLKSFIWEGKQANFEGAEEVLQDLIGHALLSLLYLKRERNENKFGMRPEEHAEEQPILDLVDDEDVDPFVFCNNQKIDTHGTLRKCKLKIGHANRLCADGEFQWKRPLTSNSQAQEDRL